MSHARSSSRTVVEASPEASAATAVAQMGAVEGRAKAGAIRMTIEEEIVTGGRVAGERLDEKALAERFGVSRTPVREAINQIASVGLVDLIPNRGAFVRAVGLGEVVEMFDVMAELEGMAGRLAARRRDPVGLIDLKTALESCAVAASAGDPDRYYDENERFHHVIYEICGNRFLAREAARLHRRLQIYRRLQLRVVHRLHQSLAEHRRIVEVIVAGDGETAERELQSHIAVQGERFGDFVANLDGHTG